MINSISVVSNILSDFNIISESAVEWIVSQSSSQNISFVQVKNFWFDTDAHFHIYELITFKRCMFTSSKITFSIVRNIVEFKPLIQCLGQFHYYAANHKKLSY